MDRGDLHFDHLYVLTTMLLVDTIDILFSSMDFEKTLNENIDLFGAMQAGAYLCLEKIEMNILKGRRQNSK